MNTTTQQPRLVKAGAVQTASPVMVTQTVSLTEKLQSEVNQFLTDKANRPSGKVQFDSLFKGIQ